MKYQQDGFFKRIAKSFLDEEKLKSPLVIKESTETLQVIEQYKQQATQTTTREQALNEKIKLLEIGLKGENSVLFELTNSFLPLHILHDVRIEHNGLRCQIDFIVLTRKFLLVIEVKNYFGNILVNEKDEFIRQVYRGNKLVFQEGFYSPIRQVERQVEVFESYLREMGAISRIPIKSVVVFSNNRTVINTKRASKQLTEKIIRLDGLVHYIKKELAKSSPVYFQDNRMLELSEYIKASNFRFTEEESDLVALTFLQEESVQPQAEVCDQTTPVVPLANRMELEKALKQFRMTMANRQNQKAYHVFTNKTLEELLVHQPLTIKDLYTISGLGRVKITNFGEELIELIKNRR